MPRSVLGTPFGGQTRPIVLDDEGQPFRRSARSNSESSRAVSSLDTVTNRVLHQRLQDHRRNEGYGGLGSDVVLDGAKLYEADLTKASSSPA